MTDLESTARVVDQSYELVPVDELRTHPDNPRRGDVEVIAESIAENGFYGVVVAQRSTSYVLVGNHRLLAARARGLVELPVMWVDVDDDRARRILLVDNRSNDLAGYDNDALAALLTEVGDLAGTGFTDDDLAELLASAGPADDDEHQADDGDAVPAAVFTVDQLVDEIVEYVDEHGPPLPDPLPVFRSMIEVNRLAALTSSRLLRTPVGLPVADTYHLHRYGVRVEGRKTLADLCKQPEALRHGVRFAVETTNMSPSALRHTLGFTRGCQVASNFRPGYALHLIRRFAPDGGTMLDTSTGFGGRLVAFYASRLARYVGIDPNPLTHAANLRMSEDLGFAERVELHNLPAEDVAHDLVAGCADFAFTSPPYFTKERYAEDDAQSCVRYPQPEAWRDGFLRPMLRLQAAALKPGSTSVINIADVRTSTGQVVPLAAWTVEAAVEAGFKHVATEELPLSRVPGQDNESAGGATGEPVLIFTA